VLDLWGRWQRVARAVMGDPNVWRVQQQPPDMALRDESAGRNGDVDGADGGQWNGAVVSLAWRRARRRAVERLGRDFFTWLATHQSHFHNTPARSDRAQAR